ncbi:MAG: hypothetical protein ACFFCG_11790, partial [Promethearchaeota archaeon]
MIQQLKLKIKELETKKQELQPKIAKFEAKKAEEIQLLNKKYNHLIQDANFEVQEFEQKIMNDLIDLF